MLSARPFSIVEDVNPATGILGDDERDKPRAMINDSRPLQPDRRSAPERLIAANPCIWASAPWAADSSA